MNEWTITDLLHAQTSGELTAKKITTAYLDRISHIDKNGPKLNAVIEINPDAMDIADTLDLERTTHGIRKPLHGVPILIKDNIDTHDKMMTTAGSMALLDSIPAEDAFIVGLLRKSGAVILGKANLSEWANFRSEHSTSGWSSRGGQTLNPYALDRNPCGSSSGSAVAVAANLCCVAVGTETDGSIVCPAHANGIVGLKPTIGLVSRSGIIPIAHSQDTAGPMARNVRDAAILLSVLSAPDPNDEVTLKESRVVNHDYTQFLDPNGLNGARIGVARNFFGYNPKIDEIINNCIDIMKELGAVIIEDANISTKDDFKDSEYEVLLYEFKHDLNLYLAKLAPNVAVHNLNELIQFNESHHDTVMPYFAQERMIKAQAKGLLSEETYIKAQETNHRLSQTEGIDATIAKFELDVIIAPTGGPTWITDWINGDHYGGASSSPAAVAGYPNITVPAGYIHGLPIGISFFASAYEESKLLKIAYAFEQATNIRRPPTFPSTVNL